MTFENIVCGLITCALTFGLDKLLRGSFEVFGWSTGMAISLGVATFSIILGFAIDRRAGR